MSKILKGLNEVNPHNYDSDWDYQDAVAKSGKSRSSYRSREDDTSDADIAYSKKMYQLSQKQKRDADHDRLASGTNEEQLDELSNEKLGQYKTAAAADAGKADIEGDYKRADKRFSGIVQATKKQFNNDAKTVKEDINSIYTEAKSLLTQLDENMQQKVINALQKKVDDEQPAEPFKTGYPRVKNPQILGTQNRAKTVYYPPSKPNVKKLDKPLPESLGDQLKSKSIEALQQVKQKLEQQRMADLEQWEKDFKQNTVSKFTAREPNLRQRATSTSMVAMPGEKHSALKARLAQLDKAIEKQGILDNLVQKLEKKGLLTPNIQAGVDTSMLVRDGARDNYVELNKKLDKALEYVKNRLLTNKAAYAKPKAIDEDVEMLDEGVLNRLGSIALGLVLAFGASHATADQMYVYQDAGTQKLRIATSLDKVPMNALMSFKVDTDSKTVSMIKGNQETPVQVQPAVVKQAQQQASGQAQQPQPTTQQPQPTTQPQPQSNTISLGMSKEQVKQMVPNAHDAEAAGTKQGGDLNKLGVAKISDILLSAQTKIMGVPAEAFYEFKNNKLAGIHYAVSMKSLGAGMGGLMGYDKSEFKEVLNDTFSKISQSGIVGKQTGKIKFETLVDMGSPIIIGDKMVAYDISADFSGGEVHIVSIGTQGMNNSFRPGTIYITKQMTQNEQSIDENDSVPTRMKMSDYYDLVDNIQEKLKQAIQTGDKARIQELNKQRDELDAHVKKHGMMPEAIDEEQLDELKCWSGYHRVAGTKAGFPGSCAKNKTNEEEEHSENCPHCGGEMVSEELMNEKKDACYYKVKSRYKVWPSAYASGALVKCRKKGASNWGTGGKKNESSILEGIEQADESLHDWFNKEKWVRMDTKGNIKGPCAREPGEGKPKCLPQSKAHSLGKKGRASAAQRKRREDPNPERSGKAINVNTKKK